MTIQTIFDAVGRLHPHHFESEDLLVWLNEADEAVHKFLQTFEGEDEAYVPHESLTEEVNADDQKIYVEYIIAMIDYYNEEFDRYNNHAIAYGSALQDWKSAYMREHTPARKARIKTS